VHPELNEEPDGRGVSQGPRGIELRLRDWLELPEEELRKRREERERERQERLEASRREVGVSHGDDGMPDPFTRA
jgi:hypothetical protein